MSSGLATFFRPDGTVTGYGIYYGTADLLLGFVADTPDAAWEAKAKAPMHPDCTCGQPAEPIIILSEYGGEWWWRGEWCPRCRCITGPCAPYVCQVCCESPYYSERHECVRVKIYEGVPRFPPPLPTSPLQSSVTVPGSQLDRAAKLAQAITASPLATTSGDDEWTVQDVLNVALSRGMDAMEKLYDVADAPERSDQERKP